MDRHERGRAAERLARDFLVEHGLETLGANWSRRVGEIDLIMREPDGTIVFVEVRYRADPSLGGALESVDGPKRRRLSRAALAWLQRCGDPDAPARIDVVAIGDAGAHESARDGAIGDRRDGKVNAGRGFPIRPERVVGRRRGHSIEWIVSAVED